MLFGAYLFCLSNLMYSINNSLSHLTKFAAENPLTSFILVYYIKVLQHAVWFDSFLARLLFGKKRGTNFTETHEGQTVGVNYKEEWADVTGSNHFRFCKPNTTRQWNGKWFIDPDRQVARQAAGESDVQGKAGSITSVSPMAEAPVWSSTLPRRPGSVAGSELLAPRRHLFPRPAGMCTNTQTRIRTRRFENYTVCTHAQAWARGRVSTLSWHFWAYR